MTKVIAVVLAACLIRLFDGESAPVAEPPSPPATLTGVASWYYWQKDEAAAGPALRELLGKDWRGKRVRVTAGDNSVVVRLTDWCQCHWKDPSERIIDLDVRSFAQLASASRGIVKVTVERVGD